MAEAGYKRVLLKLSGEALEGERGSGIDPEVLQGVCEEIRELTRRGVELGLVVGGGNLFRGVSESAAAMERATADAMGMLATVINALALQDCLERLGVACRVQSALDMPQIAEPFVRPVARRYLEQGLVVIFAAGTGNPYFSTDTAAALRAAEIRADVMLKATKVDGVYDADPVKHPGATRFATLSYDEVLARQLKVMDLTAVSLCQESRLPIIVLSMQQRGSMLRAVSGERIGTLVHA